MAPTTIALVARKPLTFNGRALEAGEHFTAPYVAGLTLIAKRRATFVPPPRRKATPAAAASTTKAAPRKRASSSRKQRKPAVAAEA